MNAPSPLLSRWRLNRLQRSLEKRGWTTERRYGPPLPLLRVYSDAAPCIGDSITLVRSVGGWWFQSSTGLELAPCYQPERAANELALLLTPWLNIAVPPRPDRR